MNQLPARPNADTAAVGDDVSPRARMRLCDLAAIGVGEMLAVKLPGVETVAVYRIGQGVHATQDNCTHAKASLTEGWLDGDRVACPAHAGEFCILTGAALCFPAATALRVFPAWIEGAAIYADLSSAAGSEA